MKILIKLLLLIGILYATNANEDFIKEAEKAYKSGDKTKAVNIVMQACNKGNVEACHILGKIYMKGNELVKKNIFKAFKFYKKSCKLGNSEDCVRVGSFYEEGKGTRQSYFKAKEFYGKACDMENEKGCKKYANLNKKFFALKLLNLLK